LYKKDPPRFKQEASENGQRGGTNGAAYTFPLAVIPGLVLKKLFRINELLIFYKE
jgi:hypothetical protein